MNKINMAWCAGLFEGEGSVSRYNGESLILQLTSTDEDVVRKLRDMAGGTMVGPYASRRDDGKTQWKWYCTRYADCIRLLQLWYPYLGERRREKIKALLPLHF